MFIQGCFIRKNTELLKNKLLNLGYYFFDPYKLSDDIKLEEKIPVFFNYKTLNNDYIVNMIIKVKLNNTKDFLLYNHIDCGINEDLFLALASLRDDSDKHQWFISNIGEWFLNHYDKFRNDIAHWTCDLESTEWHKASAEEIINHFEKK